MEMLLLTEVQKYSLASGHLRVTGEEEEAVAAVEEDSGAEGETDTKEVDETVGIQGTGTGTGTGAIKVEGKSLGKYSHGGCPKMGISLIRSSSVGRWLSIVETLVNI